MIQNPEISIVTPVYNSEVTWLKELAKAVLAQTFCNIEWILVNDGSTNNDTINEIRSMQSELSAVRLVDHKENLGLPAARNTGIQLAKGRYIFFIDSDDLMAPTCLEKLWICLETNESIAFANSYVRGFGSQSYEWKGGFHEKNLFLNENRNTSCFLGRTEVLRQLWFDDTLREGCEDWAFWLAALQKGYWGYTLPEFLFYYRRGEQSSWALLTNPKKLQSFKRTMRKRYSFLFPIREKADQRFASQMEIRKVPAIPEPSWQSKPDAPSLLCLFPWLEPGGADQFNLQLLNGLRKSGWRITIVNTLESEHRLSASFEQITDDIFYLKGLGPAAIPESVVSYLIQSRSVTHIFLSNSMRGYHMLPWLRVRFPELIITDYIHCEDPEWYDGGYPTFSLNYQYFIDKTFTTSNQLLESCVAKGRIRAALDRVYIGVDTERIQPNPANRQLIRKRMGWNDHTFVMLYVARLTMQKRPDWLVEIVDILRKRSLPFKCVVIGTGPEEDYCIQQIQKRKLQDCFVMEGLLPNDEVLQWMDAADAFVLPTAYEGIALSIYEAMAKALPVLAADTGGQAELVTPETGALISNEIDENTRFRKYADVLMNWIEEPELARALGQAGRKRLANGFSLDQTIQQMNNGLLSIIPTSPGVGQLAEAYLQTSVAMQGLQQQQAEWMNSSDSRMLDLLLRHEKSIKTVKRVVKGVKRVLKNG